MATVLNAMYASTSSISDLSDLGGADDFVVIQANDDGGFSRAVSSFGTEAKANGVANEVFGDTSSPALSGDLPNPPHGIDIKAVTVIRGDQISALDLMEIGDKIITYHRDQVPALLAPLQSNSVTQDPPLTANDSTAPLLSEEEAVKRGQEAAVQHVREHRSDISEQRAAEIAKVAVQEVFKPNQAATSTKSTKEEKTKQNAKTMLLVGMAAVGVITVVVMTGQVPPSMAKLVSKISPIINEVFRKINI